MPTLSDARFDSLRNDFGFTGTTSDMMLDWLQFNGATANNIPDAWQEMLAAAGYPTSGNYQRNDTWYEYLGDQGYDGAMNDRELLFWLDGGIVTPPTGPPIVIANDSGSAYTGVVTTTINLNGRVQRGEFPITGTLWTFTGPGGGTWGNATAIDTNFTPDTEGTYTLTLTATPSSGLPVADTAPLESTAIVDAIVDAQGPYNGFIGVAGAIEGTITQGTFPTQSVLWSKFGTSGTIADPTSLATTFTPDDTANVTLTLQQTPTQGPPVTAFTSYQGVLNPNPIEFVNGPITPFDSIVGVPVFRDVTSFFTGDFTPFTYSLTGTAWPSWVILDPNTGIITGTPDGLLSSSGHTITGTDTDTNTAVSNTFTINVIAASQPIAFTGTIPDIDGFVGIAITPVDTAIFFSGTEGPFTYIKQGTWPSWADLDLNTGVISGIPDADATTSGLIVRGTDTTPDVADSNTFDSIIAVVVDATVDAGGPYTGAIGVAGAISGSVIDGTFPTDTTQWIVFSGGTGTFGDDSLLTTTFTPDTATESSIFLIQFPTEGASVADGTTFTGTPSGDFIVAENGDNLVMENLTDFMIPE
jgi:hypothetical protein